MIWWINPWAEVRKLRRSRAMLAGRYVDLEGNYRATRAELSAIKRQRSEAGRKGGFAAAAANRAKRDAMTEKLKAEA